MATTMTGIQVILLVGVFIAKGTSAAETAKTTRYWDCCKPTCAWRSNAGSVTNPVLTCAAEGNATVDENTQSGCNGGNSFVCNNQHPYVTDDTAYGFAAANVGGLASSSICCACYKLTFTDTAIAGKSMIVQVTNTGSDLQTNHFDLQLPAGGEGIFTQGCPKQWPAYPNSVWGAQYGGISSVSECDALPQPLIESCKFRFTWFQNADNPSATFERVTCPASLTAISQCERTDG